MDMRHEAQLSKSANKNWVMDNIKGKGIWYSMCHSYLCRTTWLLSRD